MKLRLGLFVCVACLVWLGTAANASAQGAFEVGAKGGFQTAKVTTDPSEASSDWRKGMLLGGFVRGRITDALGIQGEVLYSMNGGTSEEVIVFQTYEQTLKLDYIQVPILLHFKGAQRGPARLLAYIGPHFAFRVKAQQESFDTLFPREDHFKSNDVGLVIGGGADISGIQVELRYTHGFTNIATDFGQTEVGISSAHNRAVTLMGGITLWGRH